MEAVNTASDTKHRAATLSLAGTAEQHLQALLSTLCLIAFQLLPLLKKNLLKRVLSFVPSQKQ